MTARAPYFKVTDNAALDALRWMRRWDYDLSKDIGYLALKHDITKDQATGLVKRGLELERAYPSTREAAE